MGALVGGVSAAMGLALALPALAFYSFPTRRRTVFGGDEPIDVGPLAGVVDGKPLRVNVRAPVRRDAWTAFTDVPLGACWLVRDGRGVRALSTVCPHAGCAVDWDAARNAFACPCHDSTFAPTGERLTGPAPRPLDTLETQLVDGRVHVRFRRFRTATGDKEPL
jgi:menaquinol-cytochrome c reductase iron-sulfur subunit